MFIAALGIRILIAMWHGIFKGLLQDGGAREISTIYAPLPLIKSFEMRTLFAWSISLDSTFKATAPKQKENFAIIHDDDVIK